MQRALITGISGFVGSHLADFLLQNGGIEVFGLDVPLANKENLKNSVNKIKIYNCDIKEIEEVRDILKIIKPDKIFHLAGIAFVGNSWESPLITYQTNVFGQLNILEAVKELKIDPWIQIACSSEEYGLAKENELPINESNELRPLSPYAVSKITQDFMGYQYYKSYKMKIVRTRSFNHIGPRQNDNFAVSGFAKQIALIEKGKQESIIKVGNLESIRDFIDVRDIVSAYFLCTEKCNPGEVYNLCSGKGYKMAEILQLLLSLSKINIKVQQDPNRMRPSDVPVWIGDYSKFKKQTQWEPKINIKESLKDILNYWREKI